MIALIALFIWIGVPGIIMRVFDLEGILWTFGLTGTFGVVALLFYAIVSSNRHTGERTMFGKRKKWNAAVALMVENDYGIQRRGNPDWPGINAELEILDGVWAAKQNENEAALMMVVNLFCGYVDHGRLDLARAMYPKMMAVADPQIASGIIRANHWERFSRHIEECKKVIEAG